MEVQLMGRKHRGRVAAVSAALVLAGGIAQGAAQESTQPSTQPSAREAPQGAGQTANPASARPRIGLVLGGGGAKGAAHIGVLKVLEEMRIPVDCVAGTSMGALVGATFATGARPAEIEEQVLAIDWATTVGNQGLRDRTPIHRKVQGVTYTNTIQFGVKDGALVAPASLLATQGIEEFLRRLVDGAAYTQDFDQLPIPFRAVATDMQAAEMVVLADGDLPTAMRASMAVPGAFAPVVDGDKVLSDGGMMRNLPVDIARNLCADVVIAVSLESPPPKVGSLNSAVALAGRSLDVMIQANQRAQIATLTAADVHIAVPMGDIGSSDFQRVPETIPLGEAAARREQASLARYSLPEDQYLAWRAARGPLPPIGAPVASVEVTGLKNVNPEFVNMLVRDTVPGQPFSPKATGKDTQRIFDQGDFQKVDYRLKGDPTAPDVEIIATEKPWGPDYARLDVGLYAASGGSAGFGIYGEYLRTWLNSYGAEWRTAMQVGTTDSFIKTLFYQPMDVRQRFFVEPRIYGRRSVQNIYDDGERFAIYDFYDWGGGLDFGVNLGTVAELRAGVIANRFSAYVDTGPTALLPDQRPVEERMTLLQARYDTRDNPLLPSTGTVAALRFVDSGTWGGGEEDYSAAEGLVAKYFAWRGDTIALLASGGAPLSGDMPVYRDFTLGGLLTIPGLEAQQLRGQAYWIGAGGYQWKVSDFQSLFGQAVYAGLSFSASRMSERVDGINDGTILGSGLSIGGRTPLGPAIIVLGYADNGFVNLQLGIGRPVWQSSVVDLLRTD
jgi:NTE family protein